MLYLDSNVFIYPALYEGKKAKEATNLLKDITNGNKKGATSTLTFDEITWIISQESSREKALKQTKRILQFPNLKIIDVNSKDIISMIKNMEKHKNISPRDSIHLSIMIKKGIYTIVSDDKDFEKIDKINRKPLTKF